MLASVGAWEGRTHDPEPTTGVSSTIRVAWEGDQVETPAPRELTMSDPTPPDPAQVQRGAVALTTALRISTLLPREQDAIFSILQSLNTADELLRHQASQPNSDVYVASSLVSIVDNYRRELANLGR
jgi:hypothetical protein